MLPSSLLFQGYILQSSELGMRVIRLGGFHRRNRVFIASKLRQIGRGTSETNGSLLKKAREVELSRKFRETIESAK